MTDPLRASESRPLEGGASFSLGNRIERGLWGAVWLLLGRLVPPPFGFSWRRLLLRLLGARMEAGSRVYPSARVWLPRHLTMEEGATLGPGVQCYNMAPIHICKGAIVSQRAFLCAGDHDHRDPHFQLVTQPIRLEEGCWVAAEAFVAPGVTIGQGAVVAARGCAVCDVPEWTIWAGNPATQVGTREVRSHD